VASQGRTKGEEEQTGPGGHDGVTGGQQKSQKQTARRYAQDQLPQLDTSGPGGEAMTYLQTRSATLEHGEAPRASDTGFSRPAGQ
jgi:hypothetical protein